MWVCRSSCFVVLACLPSFRARCVGFASTQSWAAAKQHVGESFISIMKTVSTLSVLTLVRAMFFELHKWVAVLSFYHIFSYRLLFILGFHRWLPYFVISIILFSFMFDIWFARNGWRLQWNKYSSNKHGHGKWKHYTIETYCQQMSISYSFGKKSLHG